MPIDKNKEIIECAEKWRMIFSNRYNTQSISKITMKHYKMNGVNPNYYSKSYVL